MRLNASARTLRFVVPLEYQRDKPFVLIVKLNTHLFTIRPVDGKCNNLTTNSFGLAPHSRIESMKKKPWTMGEITAVIAVAVADDA
jgi:hypothetical protein